MRAEDTWEISVIFTHFCCESKCTLKIKYIYMYKINNIYN